MFGKLGVEKRARRGVEERTRFLCEVSGGACRNFCRVCRSTSSNLCAVASRDCRLSRSGA
jgi:hypothetical protein